MPGTSKTSDIELENVRKNIDHLLDELINEFYASSDKASYLARNPSVSREYYGRYTIEIILRLRLKRSIDALTIHYFTKTQPYLAKQWSEYTADEMLHDELFLKDLERLGYSREDVYGQRPFLSTKLLQGYFYYGLEHDGNPLASLSSSYFIEYMSQITQQKWLENVKGQLGDRSVKGSLAHVSHDENEDHVVFVWDVIKTFLKTQADVDKVHAHIRAVYHLFVLFFAELYNGTVEGRIETFPRPEEIFGLENDLTNSASAVVIR